MLPDSDRSAGLVEDAPFTESETASSHAPWQGEGSLPEGSALAEALEPFRVFLTLVARREIGPVLAPKLGASDLVQETFLAAQRHIETFRGRTEPEWRAWLKAILLNHLANQRRAQAADKRQGPEPRSGRDLQTGARAVTPPSRDLMRRERDAALAEAVRRLPERYRQVVCWRHHDRLGFDEIGARLEVTADAAQKVWGRALVRLKELLGPEHDPR